MKKKILIVSLLLIFKIGFPQSDNYKQMRLFNKLWKKIDNHYASFEIKGINWQESYDWIKPKISEELTQEQLMDTLALMLKPFNDGHVGVSMIKLFPFRWAKGFNAERESQFYTEFYNDSLRNALFQTTNSTLIEYGFDSLQPSYSNDENTLDFSRSTDIGYIHMSHMSGISVRKTRMLMEQILIECTNYKGMIIDVRDNQGGYPKVGDQVAGGFINEKIHVSNDYKRKKKDHNSFRKPKPYYCKPISKTPFIGKVIILTNDRTRSAGDNFVMSLMDLPNVTIIGDRTEGILGEAKIGFLPYGWIYGVNKYKILSPDGVNYEGVGIPPDISIQNKRSDLELNRDPLIDKAIEVINEQ